MDEIKKCEWCGKEIYGRAVWHGLYKFCSNKCLNQWAKENPDEAKTAKKKGRWFVFLFLAAFLAYLIFVKK